MDGIWTTLIWIWIMAVHTVNDTNIFSTMLRVTSVTINPNSHWYCLYTPCWDWLHPSRRSSVKLMALEIDNLHTFPSDLYSSTFTTYEVTVVINTFMGLDGCAVKIIAFVVVIRVRVTALNSGYIQWQERNYWHIVDRTMSQWIIANVKQKIKLSSGFEFCSSGLIRHFTAWNFTLLHKTKHVNVQLTQTTK